MASTDLFGVGHDCRSWAPLSCVFLQGNRGMMLFRSLQRIVGSVLALSVSHFINGKERTLFVAGRMESLVGKPSKVDGRSHDERRSADSK